MPRRIDRISVADHSYFVGFIFLAKLLGRSPSVRELAAHCKRAPSGVGQVLRRLESAGVLTREGRRYVRRR